ncbi:unnamed protein product [Phytophthora fragariaefolia]|uniref:Unnamed protein product n=1 Tax=Phytophthora fragariaefolia TaxID=1490495 RepID=A0A9W7DAP4_9STRA|nr:unnamed protein product [Phytophthora fragariaefolia]
MLAIGGIDPSSTPTRTEDVAPPRDSDSPAPQRQRQTSVDLSTFADDGYVVQRSGRAKRASRLGTTIGEAVARTNVSRASTEPTICLASDRKPGKRSTQSRETTLQSLVCCSAWSLWSPHPGGQRKGLDMDAMADISFIGIDLAQSSITT